jgi:hypothetical protein
MEQIQRLPLGTAYQRRTANARRFSHHHEAQLLQMAHKRLGDDMRHELGRVAFALAAVKSKRERADMAEIFARLQEVASALERR